jgi:hypothetical protein
MQNPVEMHRKHKQAKTQHETPKMLYLKAPHNVHIQY